MGWALQLGYRSGKRPSACARVSHPNAVSEKLFMKRNMAKRRARQWNRDHRDDVGTALHRLQLHPIELETNREGYVLIF